MVEGLNTANDRKMLDSLHFVHCAIPNLSLNGIDISYNIESLQISSPIFIEASEHKSAKELSSEYRGVPVISRQDGAATIFIDGKDGAELRVVPRLVVVGDGLEAAKVIRLDEGRIPVVGEEHAADMNTYIKQLRMAMFLTNSKNVEELRRAPVFKM